MPHAARNCELTSWCLFRRFLMHRCVLVRANSEIFSSLSLLHGGIGPRIRFPSTPWAIVFTRDHEFSRLQSCLGWASLCKYKESGLTEEGIAYVALPIAGPRCAQTAGPGAYGPQVALSANGRAVAHGDQGGRLNLSIGGMLTARQSLGRMGSIDWQDVNWVVQRRERIWCIMGALFLLLVTWSHEVWVDKRREGTRGAARWGEGHGSRNCRLR